MKIIKKYFDDNLLITMMKSRNVAIFYQSPRYAKSILILSSHELLALPKGHFPVGLSVKILKAFIPSSILATWPPHLNLLDLITLTILDDRYKQWSSSLWSLLHFAFSSLLGPNIRLRIRFSNTPSLHSSLNVRGHVSQPHSLTGNSIVLYILIFKFLDVHPFPTS